jgi:site-specific recombinase XerD
VRLLENLEALGRKRSTIEGYGSALRVHLAPPFGGKALDGITREDVEAFMAHRAREGGAIKSTLDYIGVLHGIFDHAVRRGWAQSNPVKLAERPRKAEGREVRFLTMAEVEQVLRAVPDATSGGWSACSTWRPPPGMRQGS